MSENFSAKAVTADGSSASRMNMGLKQGSARLGDPQRIAQLAGSGLIKIAENKQQIDIRCGAEPPLGGAAKKNDGA